MEPTKDSFKSSHDIHNDGILVKTKSGRQDKVLLHDIHFLKADGNYTTVFTAKESYIITCQIGKLAEKLVHPTLVKVHRSYVINVHKVESRQGRHVVINGKEIPIGKKYMSSLFKHFRSI